MSLLLYFLAGFGAVALAILIGYYIRLRLQRKISVSEFRHRLKKLL